MIWQSLLGVALGSALGYGGGYLSPRWMKAPARPWAIWALTAFNGLVTGLMAWEHGLGPYFWHQLLFVAILSVAAFVDLHDRIIPNELVLFGIGAWLLLMLVAPYPEKGWLLALGGGLAAGGFFYLLAALVPEGMGLGDVKLVLVMGLFMGLNWVGMGLVFAFIAGGLISLGLLAARLVERKGHIPFGPFLALGGLLTLLWGGPIWSWYTGW